MRDPITGLLPPMAHDAWQPMSHGKQDKARAIHLRSQKNHGVLVAWFDVNGTIYGHNSRRGITDTDGNEIEHIQANVAASILLAMATLPAYRPYRD